MPFFSIVIPTQARADTLRHALRTALAEPDQDIEIIVHESGDDPATSAVLADLADPRLRSFKTRERVRMSENWERALRQTTGDYVLFIGDDDGLLPGACGVARSILRSYPTDILSWRPSLYYWPSYFEPKMANRLRSWYGKTPTLTLRNSKAWLHLLYNFRKHYLDLPMIYNSFISRRLIDRAYAKQGHYFMASAPDIVSAVVNLHFSDHFVHFNRPLSITGVSGHSTGARLTSGLPDLQAASTQSAFGEWPIHPTSILSYDPTISLGNELLIAKDELFPNEPPEFNYAAMLQTAVRRNDLPSHSESLLEQCRAIAKKNAIQFDEGDLTPRQGMTIEPTGSTEIEPGIMTFHADSSMMSAENIYDAARVLDSHLLSAASSSLRLLVEPPQARQIHLSSAGSALIDFSSGGNGALLLGLGWAQAEDWGVWSITSRAELLLPLDESISGSLDIDLHGMIFHPPRTMRLKVRQGSDIIWHREFQVEHGIALFDISPIDVGNSSLKELAILIEMDGSLTPSQAGVNAADTRPLRFGLQRLVVTRTGMHASIVTNGGADAVNPQTVVALMREIPKAREEIAIRDRELAAARQTIALCERELMQQRTALNSRSALLRQLVRRQFEELARQWNRLTRWSRH